MAQPTSRNHTAPVKAGAAFAETTCANVTHGRVAGIRAANSTSRQARVRIRHAAPLRTHRGH
jgi:hypothetical protein